MHERPDFPKVFGERAEAAGLSGRLGWNYRRNALWLATAGLGGAACPGPHDGAGDTKRATSWAKTLRSGQLVGRWTRMRAACSSWRPEAWCRRRGRGVARREARGPTGGQRP
jgi:hypothetical protein